MFTSTDIQELQVQYRIYKFHRNLTSFVENIKFNLGFHKVLKPAFHQSQWLITNSHTLNVHIHVHVVTLIVGFNIHLIRRKV